MLIKISKNFPPYIFIYLYIFSVGDKKTNHCKSIPTFFKDSSNQIICSTFCSHPEFLICIHRLICRINCF